MGSYQLVEEFGKGELDVGGDVWLIAVFPEFDDFEQQALRDLVKVESPVSKGLNVGGF